MENDKYMTLSEVAELLRLSKPRIYNMAQAGEIPCIQIKARGKRLFSRTAIDEWLKNKGNR